MEPVHAVLMTFQIVETPLGWVVLVCGEQSGDAHPGLAAAIEAAMAIMRRRGVYGPGRWLLEWDDSYRWHRA